MITKILNHFFHKEKSRDKQNNNLGNNTIIIVEPDGAEHFLEKDKQISGLNLRINGNDNILKFSAKAKFHNTLIEVNASNCLIEIEDVQSVMGVISIWNGNHQKFIWHSGIGSLRFARFYLCQENSSIEIGKGCVLSDVTIWTSDAHPLIDADSEKRLNEEPGHIIIGANSWLATECMLLKNARIPECSIVGARSLITSSFIEKYTIIAGNPAKIIKQNIVWSEGSLEDYRHSKFVEN